MTTPHFSRADNSNIDSVVGGGITLCCPDVGRKNERGSGKSCFFEEGSTVSHGMNDWELELLIFLN
jgi:hypothetical protein